MRIGELSRRAGVPVPTIKYYLRENLLPPGELTSPNQARYGDEHVRRLRLIRALVDVGGLSINQVGDVLSAVDSPGNSVFQVLGLVQERITAAANGRTDDANWQAARREVEELLMRRGWEAYRAESPPGRALTAVVLAMRELGQVDFVTLYDDYAAACERIAESDLGYLAKAESRENVVERMVIGTVLGDAALIAIRRLAHQVASRQRYMEETGHPCLEAEPDRA